MGGTEAARVHFFSKKVDDFFNRRPQNSPVHIFAIFEAHMTLREKTVLLY